MIKFTAVTRGIKNIEQDLRAEGRRQVRAMDTAVRVEGFRLRTRMASEVRKGAPGGQAFDPLSMIRQQGLRRKKPLSPLARSIRYHVAHRSPAEVRVGWTGPRVSDSWKRIALKHQAGYTIRTSDLQRRYLAGRGGRLKRSRFKPYFFIRDQTRHLKAPARPIIEPFWRRHERQSRVNISRNFVRKLRGERI